MDENIVIEPETSPADEPLFAEVPVRKVTRNRTGIKTIFYKRVDRGERLTLREAVDVLIEHWPDD